MKWTGIGVFSHEGKDYFPGDDLPKEAFSLDEDGGARLARLKKKGAIDGRLSGEQYEAAQARVEENRKKSEGKESSGHKSPGRPKKDEAAE